MSMKSQMVDYPIDEELQLRHQGLTDNVIIDELGRRGYSMDEIQMALSQVDEPAEPAAQTQPLPSSYPPMGGDNIAERIEEIAESIIDEKWDQLIAEVKKIIEWKDRVEAQQAKIMNDLEKLQEDFTVLHQGVLGKLEEYDSRMTDVSTELKAVGGVFKDVIPEFVDNVKELSSLTTKMKGQRKSE